MLMRRRWCGWCMAVGVAMFLWGVGAAAAEFPDRAAGSGPTWQVIATVLGGFAISLVGAYAKGLDGRVKDAERIISALTTKAEVSATQLVAVQRSLAELHRRLDYMHVPHVRPPYQDDGA